MPLPLKIKFHEAPLKRPVWLTDLDDCNYIISIARMVCAQPDKYRIEQLRQAIADAEHPARTTPPRQPGGPKGLRRKVVYGQNVKITVTKQTCSTCKWWEPNRLSPGAKVDRRRNQQCFHPDNPNIYAWPGRRHCIFTNPRWEAKPGGPGCVKP